MKRGSLIVVFALLVAMSVTAGGNTLVVKEVREDSTVVFDGGFTVHLTGVTLPDAGTEFGREAYGFLKHRIENQRVAVFTWTTDNTATGIVWSDDGLAFATIMYGRDHSTDVAAQLLERGLAWVDPEHLPEGSAHYRDVERAARDAGYGVWAIRSASS